MAVPTRNAPTLADRYRDPLPIRSRGAFQVLSARRADDGRACVVVLPGASAEPRRIAEAFAVIEDAHGRIDHPGVPWRAARSARRPSSSWTATRSSTGTRCCG